MNILIIILLIIVIFFLINNTILKKKAEKSKQEFIDNWGVPKKDEYYNFHAINRYFKNNQHRSEAFQIISDKTKIDLDLEDVFKYIDRTSSKVGQHYQPHP